MADSGVPFLGAVYPVGLVVPSTVAMFPEAVFLDTFAGPEFWEEYSGVFFGGKQVC